MSNLPIDHGWAWMCTLGAAVCMFFFIGMLRSMGILLVDVIARFDASSAIASLLLGLMGAGVSLSAPLGNAIGARYDSYRSVITWGATVIFVSTLVTSFATSIYHIVFIFGIFAGIGMGVIAGPAIVMVGMYFDKRRSLANGLATAGGSIGQLVIPILMRFLLDTFSFQGGMMIFAAICLHIIPATMLMRPLSFYNRSNKKAPIRGSQLAGKVEELENGNAAPAGNGVNGHAKLENNEIISSTGNGVHSDGKGENGHAKVGENGVNDKADYERNGHQDLTYGANGDAKKQSDNGYTALGVLNSENDRVPPPAGDSERRTSTSYFRQRSRKYSSVSTDSHPQNKRKFSVYSSQMSLALQPPAGQLPKTTKHAPWSQVCAKTACCCCIDTPKEVVPLVTWKLFRSKVFCLYLFGVCMGNSGYLNALLFLPPYAEELQISKTTTAILMSAVGIADLFSRIFGGWFGDLGIITRDRQLALSLIVTGVSTVVCTCFPYFASLVTMLAILGLLGGFYLSLMAVVLVDLMGLENLSAGFGLTIMMQGVTNIFLPTGLGYISDVTGSYKIPFMICGVMMFLGGVSFILQPKLVKYEKNRKQKEEAKRAEQEELSNIETNI